MQRKGKDGATVDCSTGEALARLTRDYILAPLVVKGGGVSKAERENALDIVLSFYANKSPFAGHPEFSDAARKTAKEEMARWFRKVRVPLRRTRASALTTLRAAHHHQARTGVVQRRRPADAADGEGPERCLHQQDAD